MGLVRAKYRLRKAARESILFSTYLGIKTPLFSFRASLVCRPQLVPVAKLILLVMELTWSFTSSETEIVLPKKVTDILCSRRTLFMFSLHPSLRAPKKAMMQHVSRLTSSLSLLHSLVKKHAFCGRMFLASSLESLIATIRKSSAYWKIATL